LFDASGAISPTPAAPPAIAYPFDADETNATDNQIIRLQDGSLLASKNGYVWSDLSPRPEWFDPVDVAFSGRSGSASSRRARNAVYLFHSNDHGITWTLRSKIDAAIVAGGDFGWPQSTTDDDGLHIGVGGFDRTELYQDPWTGDLYVAGHGGSGPITIDGVDHDQADASVIFRSTDNGNSWTLFQRFDGSGSISFMTSTPNHPLVALRNDGDHPTLWYLPKGSGVLLGGQSVAAQKDGDTIPMRTASFDDSLTKQGGGGHRIARMSWDGGSDRVWVAYPTLDGNGRQLYVVCAVEFGGGDEPDVELITIIGADDPTGSCVLGAFVQDDLVEWNRSSEENFTMFYWIERQHDQTRPAIARFKVFYGHGEELQAGGPLARRRGAPVVYADRDRRLHGRRVLLLGRGGQLPRTVGRARRDQGERRDGPTKDAVTVLAAPTPFWWRPAA
jgi:hypothetical protein